MKRYSMHVESRWKRVYLVIITFYVFDFISTFVYCSNPDEEGGLTARPLMEITNSVPIGLTLNISIWAVFWAMIFFKVCPYLLKRIQESQWEKYTEAFEIPMFILVGFIPALDFVAATSWYWHVSEIYRAIIGVILYLLSLIWVRPLEKPR
jgi:hypothetical protein